MPGLLLDRLAGGDFPDQSYDYVVVDEFQDLTPGEQELMFRLRSSDGQLVALGDPRQSIYKFRGNDREGLAELDALASAHGDGTIHDAPMNECQRCPADIVFAANRLMSLSEAHAMAPVSEVTANLHLVTWADPHVEANGMAEAICANFSAHPDDRHLVMVTRRKFGYWLRDASATRPAPNAVAGKTSAQHTVRCTGRLMCSPGRKPSSAWRTIRPDVLETPRRVG